eukprot:TRINITY_DN754_c0_g2_i10.p1 TRINITY_DN754_c0_g2~~TRINITY_DN754_c0_g2_i10.p1  ORF type:complete len:451 (+),score=72.14 TRINITY_DN754_c0_g2_i10:68-1420(+)
MCIRDSKNIVDGIDLFQTLTHDKFHRIYKREELISYFREISFQEFEEFSQYLQHLLNDYAPGTKLSYILALNISVYSVLQISLQRLNAKMQESIKQSKSDILNLHNLEEIFKKALDHCRSQICISLKEYSQSKLDSQDQKTLFISGPLDRGELNVSNALDALLRRLSGIASSFLLVDLTVAKPILIDMADSLRTILYPRYEQRLTQLESEEGVADGDHINQRILHRLQLQIDLQYIIDFIPKQSGNSPDFWNLLNRIKHTNLNEKNEKLLHERLEVIAAQLFKVNEIVHSDLLNKTIKPREAGRKSSAEAIENALDAHALFRDIFGNESLVKKPVTTRYKISTLMLPMAETYNSFVITPSLLKVGGKKKAEGLDETTSGVRKTNISQDVKGNLASKMTSDKAKQIVDGVSSKISSIRDNFKDLNKLFKQSVSGFILDGSLFMLCNDGPLN